MAIFQTPSPSSKVLHVLSVLCPCWTKAVNPVSFPNCAVARPLRIVTMTPKPAQGLAPSSPTLGVLAREENKSSSIVCIHRAVRPGSGDGMWRTDRAIDSGRLGGDERWKQREKHKDREHSLKREMRPRGRERELVERETKWWRQGKMGHGVKKRFSDRKEGVICHLARDEVWWLCFCQAQRQYNGLLDAWSLRLSRLLL